MVCDPATTPICGNETCPAQLACFTNEIFPRVINMTILFVGVVALIMIIISGFMFIIARGDKKALDNARKTLFFAAIGLFIVLFSFFILNIIGEATGVRCLEPANLFQNGLLNSCQ